MTTPMTTVAMASDVRTLHPPAHATVKPSTFDLSGASSSRLTTTSRITYNTNTLTQKFRRLNATTPFSRPRS